MGGNVRLLHLLFLFLQRLDKGLCSHILTLDFVRCPLHADFLLFDLELVNRDPLLGMAFT